ncbi:response regulator transcription factor [Alicyclobacillus sp. SO9]|uniref:response regulator transcription factor n=1 Tax=Alicyclobacillus sp. SO9 TaxID=2665646 RepID=UPI0018E71BFE|nr:response regulator transcription factor [Alicyclobacillus sp. SO9]QQE79107.1 response regulator transcription factor [Alicyclobacillus sp. SO9]
MKILVVEDDATIRAIICEALQEDLYDTDEAVDGLDGLWKAGEAIYDLVVLDIMLPELDGLSLVTELRAKGVTTPVLLVTAKDSVTDRVRGLDVGADDYLVKPFAVTELLARVRALLRRNAGYSNENNRLGCGRLLLYIDTLEGYVDGTPLNLRGKEYEVLEFLVRNQGRIVTRDQIFSRIWGFDSDSGESVVDVYIHYIRKKLAQAGADAYLVTKRGVGFILREPSS